MKPPMRSVLRLVEFNLRWALLGPRERALLVAELRRAHGRRVWSLASGSPVVIGA